MINLTKQQSEQMTDVPQQTLSIIYQDEYLVVVNKPAGMLVHRSWLDKNERHVVMQQLRNQLGCHVYPVHRLDRPTSGALLFALSSQVARQLAELFELHQVEKSYLAVVRGVIDSGRIDYPLKPRLDKIADKFSNPDKPAEAAITDYQVLATTEQPFVSCKRFATSRYSLVALTPITGRKHQLRRHMKHIFHPIVGDTTYGDKVQNRAIAAHVGVRRLMLHAYRLAFVHPVTGRHLSVIAPLDDAYQKLLTAFAWQGVLAD
ncbi:tRNA pseudouridine(65) synthase TruC [Moraxella cuniculi]|uniref:tRNA pseudouridine synthase C n=1 Tax=Moraxella cuniculi TaxID=34061 RepID=A0A448GVY7_9GAMM|nr:tRNA pseudouridine(65) synthase TruC [Moraxella cuniculi]VEG12973.1 tRNA pseudouridine synthase C [Moraxella cuniculi]